jgi:hypothetical protein
MHQRREDQKFRVACPLKANNSCPLLPNSDAVWQMAGGRVPAHAATHVSQARCRG